MAIPNTSLHTRSISLPCSPQSSLDATIEDHLRRLRASQAGSSSSSSICQNLFTVKDLYEQMNNLIHLPHNQKALCRGDEEILEGSLILLDVSSYGLEALSQMKESVSDLQSSLGRGNCEEGIHAYFISRKKISKVLSKCLAGLKKANTKIACLDNDAITVKMPKESEAISLSSLKSVLSFVMGRKATSQTCGWAIVKKIVKPKNAASVWEENNEVDEVDCILCSATEKHLGVGTTKVLLKQLEALEMVIHELEDGLESVSRGLLKTRVLLLNVLNY